MKFFPKHNFAYSCYIHHSPPVACSIHLFSFSVSGPITVLLAQSCKGLIGDVSIFMPFSMFKSRRSYLFPFPVFFILLGQHILPVKKSGGHDVMKLSFRTPWRWISFLSYRTIDNFRGERTPIRQLGRRPRPAVNAAMLDKHRPANNRGFPANSSGTIIAFLRV
jgi:hypothetical protein